MLEKWHCGFGCEGTRVLGTIVPRCIHPGISGMCFSYSTYLPQEDDCK